MEQYRKESHEVQDYYDIPHQVTFDDYDTEPDENGEYLYEISGIAWQDKVICACCGGVIELSEIKEMVESDPRIHFTAHEYWADFSETIA